MSFDWVDKLDNERINGSVIGYDVYKRMVKK